MATSSSPGVLGAGVLALVQLPDGVPDDADKGILNVAGRVSGALGAPLAAVSFAAADPREIGAYGVPEIVALQSETELADFPDALAEALAGAARERGAGLLLLPHNDLGASTAVGAAARLGAALFTEAISVEAAAGGVLLQRRVLGAQVARQDLWQGATPLVLTVDPRVLSATLLPSVKPCEPRVTARPVAASTGALRKRVLERIPPDPQTVDVSEAEVIFCAGKGFDPDSFAQFQELAQLLNASLGVTRPVYDLGWTGFERMIGQTGKTVAPRFYLGMGISGSMHHVGGIKDSKHLVSLNVDPKAPMFPNSDEGFVGDLREVLPLLLDRVRAQTASRGAR